MLIERSSCRYPITLAALGEESINNMAWKASRPPLIEFHQEGEV
jgi:hypothetical protein